MARVKLTDKFVKSCKAPDQGRIEHSDSVCPGLYFRVSQGGAKTFSVLVRHGRLIRRTIGHYPLISLADARDTAREILKEAARLPASGEATPDAKPALTLQELIARYADLHLRPNLRSWRFILGNLNQPALGHLVARDVTTLEKRELIAVLDGLVAAGKPHGAGNLLKALRAMFNWAVDRGDMTHNPCDRMRQPKPTTQRDRVLSDAEIAAVLGACDAVPAPFGDLVRILLHTGARRNEVAHMRWSELTGNVWTLPAARSKSGHANSLPLPPAVMAVLDRMPRPAGGADGFVFSTTGGAKPSSDFSKRKRLLDAASSTRDWRLHDLRRTVRSKLSELGVSREVARRVVGHSVDQLDAIYDRHDYRAEKADALSRLADHLAIIAAAGEKQKC